MSALKALAGNRGSRARVRSGRSLSGHSAAAAGLLRRLGWWRAVAVLLGAGLLALGIVLLLAKLAGYSRFVDSLRGADPGWIALAPVGEAVAYIGYIAAFRAAARLDGGPRLSVWLSTRVVFASLGATRMFAAAGAGGIAVLYWVLRRAGVRRHEAIVRVLGFDILLFAFFGAVVWGAALAVELGRGQAPAAMTLSWLVGVTACVAGGISAILLVPLRDPLDPPATGRLRRALTDAVGGLVLVRRLVARPLASREALLGTVLYWVGDVLCLWAGLRAFNVEIGASALLLAYATGYVAIALPLPTGGVGGVDAAMTLALIWVGVPLAPALLGVFAYRFFSFLVPTLPGIAALATLPLLGRELRAAARPRASS